VKGTVQNSDLQLDISQKLVISVRGINYYF